jgi:hypothetical protein
MLASFRPLAGMQRQIRRKSNQAIHKIAIRFGLQKSTYEMQEA